MSLLSSLPTDMQREVMAVVNVFLRRIHSLDYPVPMHNAISMSVLDPVGLEPQLKGLLAASKSGIVGVLEELEPACTLYLGILKQMDFFTIEFYADAGTRLAVVFHHKEDGVALFHVFTDFVAVGAEDVAVDDVPGHNASGLLVVVVEVLKALGGGDEMRGVGAAANAGEFAAVAGGRELSHE